MKIGFIGTGVITEAIVTGLLKGEFSTDQIYVSHRSESTSAELASKYAVVDVLLDNQAIVDHSDVVVLAIRPQVAEEVVRPLTFNVDKQVISLIATVKTDTLLDWIGVSLPICRAIPLPFVAEGLGVTAVYPGLAVAEEIFEAIGSAVVATSIEEFDSYVVASASMGMYFDVLSSLSAYLQQQGATQDKAQAYLSGLFQGLANTATQRSEESYAELKVGHCTHGGLNEQFAKVYAEHGGVDAIEKAMQSIQARILKK